MMKTCEFLLITDTIEDAIKFYTEKLAFDITNLEASRETPGTLAGAEIRKGKCFIAFKTPLVEELAEFSFIKRCSSRCVGLVVEMKKGLDKYFTRCQKKGVKIVSELKDQGAYRSFAIRDPFGNKLIFTQLIEGKKPQPSADFAGKPFSAQSTAGRKEADVINELVDQLKRFGILRRAAKKYAKLRFKQAQGK